VVPRAARAIAGNGLDMPVTAAGIALVDGAGRSITTETSGVFDLSHVALTKADVTLLRGNGTHEVVSLDSSGREIRRQAYQVPILPRQSGLAAYVGRWVFALTDPGDLLWFAQQGRPEIYRVQ
jgi:hypothetical protein